MKVNKKNTMKKIKEKNTEKSKKNVIENKKGKEKNINKEKEKETETEKKEKVNIITKTPNTAKNIFNFLIIFIIYFKI